MAKVTSLLQIVQGSDFTKKWRWGFKDTTTQVVTYRNLSTWTSLCMVRDAPGSDGYVLVPSLPVVLSSSGWITLNIPGSTSWPWKWKMGMYDILLTDPDGVPSQFAAGRIQLTLGVSHA